MTEEAKKEAPAVSATRSLRVFVLEDDPDRIRLLAQWLIGCDWDCIHTCVREEEFRPPYDLILLDHDLGGRQLVEHEDNGLSFVRLIKDRINEEADIIVHSYNPDGAKSMVAELKPFRVQWVPFSTQIERYIKALRLRH